MSSESRFRLDAFLDGVTGAGLFGWLRRPGAPTEFIDSGEQQVAGQYQALAPLALPVVAPLAPVRPRPSSPPTWDDHYPGGFFGPSGLAQAAAADGPERQRSSRPSPADEPAAKPVKPRS